MLSKCPDLELGSGGGVVLRTVDTEEVQDAESSVSQLVTATRAQVRYQLDRKRHVEQQCVHM